MDLNNHHDRQMIGRLGGLTAQSHFTPEQRIENARRMGEAAREKLGKAHYVRMSLIRWGKLPRKAANAERPA